MRTARQDGGGRRKKLSSSVSKFDKDEHGRTNLYPPSRERGKKKCVKNVNGSTHTVLSFSLFFYIFYFMKYRDPLKLMLMEAVVNDSSLDQYSRGCVQD